MYVYQKDTTMQQLVGAHMNKRFAKVKPELWTFQKMVKENRQAIIVWTALTRMADQRGHTFVSTSRAELAAESGLETKNLRGITQALAALEQAGWIVVERPTLVQHGGFVRALRVWLVLGAENMYTGLFAARPQRAPEKPPERKQKNVNEMTLDELKEAHAELVRQYKVVDDDFNSLKPSRPLNTLDEKRQTLASKIKVLLAEMDLRMDIQKAAVPTGTSS